MPAKTKRTTAKPAARSKARQVPDISELLEDSRSSAAVERASESERAPDSSPPQ